MVLESHHVDFNEEKSLTQCQNTDGTKNSVNKTEFLLCHGCITVTVLNLISADLTILHHQWQFGCFNPNNIICIYTYIILAADKGFQDYNFFKQAC